MYIVQCRVICMSSTMHTYKRKFTIAHYHTLQSFQHGIPYFITCQSTILSNTRKCYFLNVDILRGTIVRFRSEPRPVVRLIGFLTGRLMFNKLVYFDASSLLGWEIKNTA